MSDRSSHRFLEALREATSRPLVVAHRGDSSHAPENTLEAARKAWEQGADAWEFDVQFTRDGIAVVLHDESLARTTDVARRFSDDPRAGSGYLVADFDFDEVRSLDAGSWFLEVPGDPRSAAGFGTRTQLSPEDVDRFASGRLRVPSLRECLELTAGLDWFANVELKTFPNPDSRLLDVVAAEVSEVGVASRVLVSSFNHHDVARAARLGLPWATGVLSETPLFRPDQYVREIVGADCYHPSCQSLGSESTGYRRLAALEPLQIDDLRALAQSRIPVLVYTVNDPAPNGLAAQLARAGVSGLFTDRPTRVRNLLGTLPK